MYEYIRKAYIQTWGMETLEEIQPDVQLGGRTLLQKMELPELTEPLLKLACKTKMSPLGSTLQETLPIGYALPVWGEGKNPVTKTARAFIQEIFEKGQQTKKPIPAADAVIMMQLKTDESGMPIFDENTYLEEDQIKSIFGTESRKRKRSESDPKKSSVSSNESNIGVDLDDEDNGEEKQIFENILSDYEIEDQEAAMQKDANQIKDDLEKSAIDSEDHPIRIAA